MFSAESGASTGISGKSFENDQKRFGTKVMLPIFALRN
jgi:hypothetical protein